MSIPPNESLEDTLLQRDHQSLVVLWEKKIGKINFGDNTQRTNAFQYLCHVVLSDSPFALGTSQEQKSVEILHSHFQIFFEHEADSQSLFKLKITTKDGKQVLYAGEHTKHIPADFAVASTPIDGCFSDFVICSSPLEEEYNTLFLEAKKRNLVNSKSQFQTLFPIKIYSDAEKETVLTQLAVYRQLQQLRSDLYDQHFFHLLNSEHLDRDPKNISAKTVFVDNQPSVIETEKEDLAKEAYLFLTSRINVIPRNTAVAQIQAQGLQPCAAGFHNWKSTCYMNASLQLLHLHLSSTDTIQSLSESMPIGALENLIQRYYPSADFSSIPATASKEESDTIKDKLTRIRNDKIQQLAVEASARTHDDLVTNGITLANTSETYCIQLAALFRFKQALIDLQLCLETKERIEIPIREQVEFLEAYANLARVTNNSNMLRFIGNDDPILYSQLIQSDPEEFINTINLSLGFTSQPNLILGQLETICMRSRTSGNVLLQSKAASLNPLTILPIQVLSPKLTLQANLEEFLKSEQMSDYIWEPKQLQQHGVLAQDVITEKQLQLTSTKGTLPSSLLLQTKLFDNNGNKLSKITNSGSNVFEADIGHAILENALRSDRIITIPILLGDDTTLTPVRYRVDAVLCHAGKSRLSGHFTMLKLSKDPNDAIYFNDDIVLSWQQFVQLNAASPEKRSINSQTKTCTTLISFCQYEVLSGYLYYLTRID
ncbi:MAG: ubiquitin carboxyl-terminal hydrolase [Parashewanella sp.]